MATILETRCYKAQVIQELLGMKKEGLIPYGWYRGALSVVLTDKDFNDKSSMSVAEGASLALELANIK